MALRLLRLPEVCARLGLRTTAIYHRIKCGTLPAAIPLIGRTRAWPEHEIDAIVGAHIAGDNENEIRALVQDLVAQRQQHSARITHRHKRS
jgi:prophage regulatory protein